GVVAALHSGWRGTAQNAPVNALNIMCEHGSSIKDIVVAIGPSIKGCCYDVGIELFERFMALDSDYAAAFARRNGKWYLNLTQIIEKMLVNTGVSPEKISICPDCTKCNNNLYFSHRLSGANRGTMGAFICV
ncbi:MAG: polyphenol oxidase family protein, partial [Clostridia bacterium]